VTRATTSDPKKFRIKSQNTGAQKLSKASWRSFRVRIPTV